MAKPMYDDDGNRIYCPECGIRLAKRPTMKREDGETICEPCFMKNPFGEEEAAKSETEVKREKKDRWGSLKWTPLGEGDEDDE